MIYYCSSTGGFYEDSINGKAIPDDKVEITPAYRLELLNGERLGKRIVPDKNGYPTLADIPAPTEQELRDTALATRDRLMKEASTMIATFQDAVELGEATPEEVTTLTAWKRYRIGLVRIEQQPNFPSQVDWPLQPNRTKTKSV